VKNKKIQNLFDLFNLLISPRFKIMFDIFFNEGFKEKLEELKDDSFYFKFGKLIAKREMDFDVDLIENYTGIIKEVSKKSNKESTLDW
jgi:hypothetical protein